MAPEVSGGKYTAKADIFSLGIPLYTRLLECIYSCDGPFVPSVWSAMVSFDEEEHCQRNVAILFELFSESASYIQVKAIKVFSSLPDEFEMSYPAVVCVLQL